MARANLKKLGKYPDVYEACLYGDDDNDDGAATAAEDEAATGGAEENTVVKGGGNRPDGAREDGDGGGGRGGGADSPATPRLLPPSGWRALSRNGAEGEISRSVSGGGRNEGRAVRYNIFVHPHDWGVTYRATVHAVLPSHHSGGQACGRIAVQYL